MMQIYRCFKFTDFIICKFARKFIFTAFRYTHDDDDDDEDEDDDDDDGPNSPLVEEPSLSLLGNGHFDLKLNTTFRKDSQPLAHILFIDF